ncbi:LuxR C-terminal-related transcriptional regulator [Paenibacillus sp. GCM10027628]|uniref:LuxR C-terminal-related transcriptional regulator n=1 Tax=Paenibacillus sp. GCM10027628 TaxID=3273413 RepID=UPI003638F79F
MFQRSDLHLLQTKMHAPGTKENLVNRERLIRMMMEGMKGRLTTVCAPAGFGKSTLLSQWEQAVDAPCAWVSLDVMDDDPMRFWRYVVHALAAKFVPPADTPLRTLAQALPNLSTPTFLDALINELFAYGKPIAIILDDYHTITDPRIHDSVSYLIEYLPDSAHILIASRMELPFSTAKWVARSEHTQLDAVKLQFTLTETEAFYREVAKLPLSPSHIEKLVQRTEGWVTALQLASISLRTEANYDQFIEGFQGDSRKIADYLLQEVVSKLPHEIYDFVLTTSVLDRMDVSVCDAVTGRTDSLKMLEALRMLNLFHIPLDEQNVWFRYHHVFSQFLRSLLKRQNYPFWLEAHRRASLSFAARGFKDEAIDHAIAAQDFSLMQSLLEEHLMAVLQRGEFSTLLRWFESMPTTQTTHKLSPEMSLIYAFILIVTGQLPRAEIELESVERECESVEQPQRRNELQSGILFVRSNLVFASGNFEQWFRFAAGIEMADMMPENTLFYNFNYNSSEPLVRRTAFGLKGVLSSDTETIGKQFAAVLEAHGWHNSLINLYLKQSLCEGYYEWNRLDESYDLLRVIERAPQFRQTPGLFVPHHITEARIHLAKGDTDWAQHLIQEAIDTVVKLSEFHWLEALRAFQIQIWLSAGQLAQAKKAAAYLKLSSKDRPTFNKEYAYLTFVRLLGASRKESEALRLLQAMKPQAARESLLSSMAEIAILQARMEMQRGQRKAALHHLHEALQIGERNGYIRSFVDEGEAMAELLEMYGKLRHSEELKGETVSETYVQTLLGLLAGAGVVSDASKPQPSASSVLIEPLSRSEISVLNLIRQGATNREIADKLSLSEGTVKVYLSRVYAKLGVSSRTQALIAAQDLAIFG